MGEAFDLVILGSGSTAFAAALRAQELGRTAVMTESRTLGGTSVSRGCLPSKNLIEAARVYWDALHPRFPGLRPQGMELDFPALVRQKDQLVEAYREKRYASLVRESDRIRVYEGRARFTPDGAVEVDGRRLYGQHYLIATGSRPAVPWRACTAFPTSPPTSSPPESPRSCASSPPPWSSSAEATSPWSWVRCSPGSA